MACKVKERNVWRRWLLAILPGVFGRKSIHCFLPEDFGFVVELGDVTSFFGYIYPTFCYWCIGNVIEGNTQYSSDTAYRDFYVL